MSAMLRFLTGGESHGPSLTGILEGLPAGLELSEKDLNIQLQRRQGGYGRGERMGLERDEAEIAGGLWKGKTTGAPLVLILQNKGARDQEKEPVVTTPRPGHADLAGAIKYGHWEDLNPVIERASARETAMRTAIGAVCMKMLKEFGIEVFGHVVGLGSTRLETPDLSLEEMRKLRESSSFYCLSLDKEGKLKARVDEARKNGDTLGGIVEVLGLNVPAGLGSYVQYDRRLDARLAFHLMSIPACKGMEVGDGIASAGKPGSQVHDPIRLAEKGIERGANRAGGIEGGVTNGERIVIRAYFKPLPTLKSPLPTIDLVTGKAIVAPYIRSDVTVVPAASVIAESLVGFVLAQAFLERFGGDTLEMVKSAYQGWKEEYRKRFSGKRST
jgi:chorismate synthase